MRDSPFDHNTHQAELEYLRLPSRVRPTRPDGEPNRPLSGFTVEIIDSQPRIAFTGRTTMIRRRVTRLFAVAIIGLAATAHAEGLGYPAGLRYMAIGDSITAGHADGSVRSYAEQLRDDPGPFTTIINAGRTGYTSADVLQHWRGLVELKPRPHVVTIMLGRNDTSRYVTLDPIGVDDYVRNIRMMVMRLRANPHGDLRFNWGRPDIVLLSPPFMSAVRTPAATSPEELAQWRAKQARHEIYTEALRALAVQLDVRFLNVYDITGRAVGWDDTVWSMPEWTRNGDGSHPTTAVHAMLMPYIRATITARTP